MVVKRFEVYLINLDPTVGSEIQKTRPCLVISPDEMNRFIRTVIVAPMTTRGAAYPTRVVCRFQGKQGQVVLDQIRTVDKTRLARRLGLPVAFDFRTGLKIEKRDALLRSDDHIPVLQKNHVARNLKQGLSIARHDRPAFRIAASPGRAFAPFAYPAAGARNPDDR